MGTPVSGEPGGQSTLTVASRLSGYLRGGGVLVPLATVALALLAGGLVVAATGSNPISTYKAIFDGTGLNWLFPWISSDDRIIAAQNLQQTLILTTPLILTGLAVAYAFRAGMFNIGGQGQYIAGAVIAVWVGSSFDGLPTVLHILLSVVLAAVAGGVWAGIAGVLKARTGANEVITTIMLNYVALWVGTYLFRLGGPLQSDTQASVPISNEVLDSAKLPVFWGDAELQGLHIGIFVALFVAFLYWVLLNRSVAGYEVRAVGFNPDAAEYGGIKAGATYIRVMFTCGIFAGLAGAMNVLGWQFTVATNDISGTDVGFVGIAVALLGRNTALGVCFSALFFGGLINGTSVRNLDPAIFEPELAQNLAILIQGLVILLVSAPVLVGYLVVGARRLGIAREDGVTLAERANLRTESGAVDPKWIGWAGVAVAAFAWYLTLPPLLVRSPVPSLLLALVAAGLGIVAVRRGARRVGWGAVVAAVVAVVGAWAATRSGIGNLERVVVWSGLGAAMLRYATPLTFAALGGVVSERAGVVNIGLEGMMLVGAFFGIWGADVTGSWIGGLAIGMVAGGLLALVHAVFAVTLRADQIVSGFALNLLALGLTGYIFLDVYGAEGTPDGIAQVPDVSLPIGWIPIVGGALEQLNLLVWLSLIAVFVVWLVVFRMPVGLRMRSVGENPRAAETVGISVYKTRYVAVVTSGVLAAMGGAFLSIGFVHSFNQGMTAGRGFIALAAVIFGRWKPGGALAAALLFGFSSALAQRLPVFSPSTATLFQALPYVLTLIAVAGIIGRSTPPAADGVPYKRE